MPTTIPTLERLTNVTALILEVIAPVSEAIPLTDLPKALTISAIARLVGLSLHRFFGYLHEGLLIGSGGMRTAKMF